MRSIILKKEWNDSSECSAFTSSVLLYLFFTSNSTIFMKGAHEYSLLQGAGYPSYAIGENQKSTQYQHKSQHKISFCIILLCHTIFCQGWNWHCVDSMQPHHSQLAIHLQDIAYQNYPKLLCEFSFAHLDSEWGKVKPNTMCSQQFQNRQNTILE